jgi:D-alanyl-D-alanine carboxypeptidase
MVIATPLHAAGPSIVVDVATGEVISQERTGEPWYPASLTKLMTAYLVFGKIRSGELALDKKVNVSVIASAQPPSKIGMKPGSAVSVDFALQTLLVYSANDMAYVLAEAAGGTVQNFVRDMNATAQKLGLTATHFVNPNGLFDPRQITTARDISILASRLLVEFPEHAHYFSQPFVAVGKRKLANRNSLIRQMPEADGMKTGFVCNSGFNLVATATRGERKLLAVVMGAPSAKGRADLAQMLLVDGFARSRPTGASWPRIGTIRNLALGAVVPADMTSTVCKTKPLPIVRAKNVEGWGISFGTYETAEKADMALRGRILSASGIGTAGSTGLLRMPAKSGFAAVLWNLDQQTSLALCSRYRAERAVCEVMTPDTFQKIAVLTPEPIPSPPRKKGKKKKGTGDKTRTLPPKGTEEAATGAN